MKSPFEKLAAEVDALERLQTETTRGELKAEILKAEMQLAILRSSPGFRLRVASPRQVDPTGDRAFKGER